MIKTDANDPIQWQKSRNGENYTADERDYLNHGNILCGLTKREYIATKIMAANLSNPDLLQAITAGSITNGTAAELCAKTSVKWADELIKALNE